jgi:hypothetical protein
MNRIGIVTFQIRIARCVAALSWMLPAVFLTLVVIGEGTNAQGGLNPAMEQIRARHQEVLDEMNARDKNGNAAPLDDPKIPDLLKKGWNLAGLWAAEYLESHPRPSGRELERIFEGFAAEPKGYKSKHGSFLEYRDYSFSGGAVAISPDIYVVHASYALDFPSTGTFMVVA